MAYHLPIYLVASIYSDIVHGMYSDILSRKYFDILPVRGLLAPAKVKHRTTGWSYVHVGEMAAASGMGLSVPQYSIQPNLCRMGMYTPT